MLRKTLATDGWSDAAFLAAVEDGLARPERVAARLFPLRAEALLHGLDPVAPAPASRASSSAPSSPAPAPTGSAATWS